MEFEWTLSKPYEDLPEKEYINPCCIGCDEILAEIKNDIADEMQINENQIVIYQEDWGWALEFMKENVDYFLGLSNYNISEIGKTSFGAYIQATRKEKGLIFNKTVDAENELDDFSEIVSKIAKRKGFES